MYRLFLSAQVGGHANDLLRQHLLGVPLGQHWLGGAILSAHGLVFACLFALIALVGWASARLARRFAPPPPPAAASQPPGGARASARPGPDTTPGAGAAGLITKVAPYATVVVAMFIPLAAGIYLLTTTTWTVAERRLLLARARGAADRHPGHRRPGQREVTD